MFHSKSRKEQIQDRSASLADGAATVAEQLRDRVGPALGQAAESAMEWGQPRVKAARRWAQPRVEHGIEIAAPRLESAVSSLAPKVDVARDKIVDELLPRVTEAITGWAAASAAAKDEVVARGAGAAAVVSGDAVAKPKRKKKGKAMLTLSLLGAAAAGAAAFLKKSAPKDDPWATPLEDSYIAPSNADASSPLRVTLAFDTGLVQQSRLDTATYLAPNIDDAAFGSTFFFASTVDDVSQLLGEPWFDTWLAAVAAAATDADAPPFEHLHIARYLTLLRVLAASGVMPEVRLTDTIQRRFPIRSAAVDLILDIGDAETTALLVDVPQDGVGDLAPLAGYAEPLRLRDLSEPHIVHEGPFPTAAEFDGAPFGDVGLSRVSGRIDAFQWPSLVRIGHEARRLALRNNGTEGVTGLSNLRSFLLDDHANPGLWRQSTDDCPTGDPGPMVSGPLLSFVGENGALIGGESFDPSRPEIPDQRPAIRPRFSRASMIGFFAAELVLHTLAQINAIGRDGVHSQESDVRQLRQVVVLAPSSLAAQERQALLSRVDQGLILAWHGLGWDHAAPGVPKRPVVTLGLGGDLGTQIAFLHNEVTAKYQGRFRDLLRVYRGGGMAGNLADALRVASVDFGARATTLAIVDYAAADGSVVASEWQPSVQLQERLPIGTDAALQALIWSLVLPAIERHLEMAGLVPARHFLDEITGRSATSLLVEDPYFTRRLNRKILWPAANGLFSINQHGAASLSYGNRSVSLATLVELGGGRMDGIAAAFDAAALQAGARGFTLDTTKIALERGELAHIIGAEMLDCVQQISRIVAGHSCDLLLLGGDGTRLSPVRDAVLAALPVPASRIIDLNLYANHAASEAVGDGGFVPTAVMLPAIASALDRRQLLEASGFGSIAMTRLALAPPTDDGNAQRAISAPLPRDDVKDRGNDRVAAGRAGSLPAKGA